MESLSEILHNYLFVAAGSLMLLQSVILFVRGKNDMAKKTMAILELVWSLSYFSVVMLMNSALVDEAYVPFREKYVLIGGYFISFMAIYLMQILIPGWLNWKRFFLIELPFIGMTVIYYAGVFLLKEPIAVLTTYEELYDSIGQFNVWTRFVILVFEIVYLVFILVWLNRFKKKYLQWEEENYADQETFDISWISTYNFIIVGITVFYLGVFFIGGRIPILFHTAFVIISFSYMFYKALFHESPYPTDFFDSLDENKQKEKSDEILVIASTAEQERKAVATSFDMRLEENVQLVKDWLEHEQPYLHTDFKLTDVSRVLPLNRSYLSRLFNEGFGGNFSDVIRKYRIDYAREVIQKHPEIPIAEVSTMCGFNSQNTFFRAFKLIMGMTPKQFQKMQSEYENQNDLNKAV